MSLYESHQSTDSDSDDNSDSGNFERDADNEAYILFTDLTRKAGAAVARSDKIRTNAENAKNGETDDRDKSPLLTEYDFLKELKSKYGKKVHRNGDTPNQPDYRDAIGQGNLSPELLTEIAQAEFGDDWEVTDVIEDTDHKTRKGKDPVFIPVFGEKGDYTLPPELTEDAEETREAPEEESEEPEEQGNDEPTMGEQAAEMKRETGKSNAKIAEELGVSTATVSKGCKKHLTADEYESLKGGNTPKVAEEPEKETETVTEGNSGEFTAEQIERATKLAGGNIDAALDMLEIMASA